MQCINNFHSCSNDWHFPELLHLRANFFLLKTILLRYCYNGIRVFVYLFKFFNYEKETIFCCQLCHYRLIVQFMRGRV